MLFTYVLIELVTNFFFIKNNYIMTFELFRSVHLFSIIFMKNIDNFLLLYNKYLFFFTFYLFLKLLNSYFCLKKIFHNIKIYYMRACAFIVASN